MQPSFLDALGLFQWLGFAVLVAAWPVYELLTLRRRARQAEERAAQLTQDYQHRIDALDVVQRQAVASSAGCPGRTGGHGAPLRRGALGDR